jgi:hypothetical protein
MTTYGGAPLVCECCNKVLEECSGYTIVQYGICDDCLAKVELTDDTDDDFAESELSNDELDDDYQIWANQ